ncbi:TPA: acyltransferase family protein [Proteus mirabilis]
MQDKKFRNDINGLRAIAVLAVMLFHFVPSSLPGGFAGVDVFFVISGFLMTSIIFRGLKNNNFSLWNFLKARARRIVPALVTVISIVLALGYLFFEPLTYQLAGKHGYSSLLFISNITYAKEAGYFDSDSLSKIFLHTWSLSVEWQFYIIYPIILLTLSKFFSTNTLKKVILVSAIISFSFCIYLSNINKTLSYFMIYTRAWEMLLGGIAFLFPLSTTDNKKRTIEILGLILIIISFFIFSNADSWPSYNALLPVLGAFFCIQANNKKTILSNIILQKIGLWSYSIYLVHWSLIVFCKKINIEINIITYFLITILLSIIIYSLIEKKKKL